MITEDTQRRKHNTNTHMCVHTHTLAVAGNDDGPDSETCAAGWWVICDR